MKCLKLMASFVIFNCTFLHSVEWTPAIALPESQAIVKTTAQIAIDAALKKQSLVASQSLNAPGILIPSYLQRIKRFSYSTSHPLMDVHQKLPDFTAARFEDSGVVPPDAMGVVGPTQFILAANGRIRSFDKETGFADHVLDISTSDFFSSVSDGFTTDSRIRYDRFSDRWFIVILAPSMSPIRLLLGVSASGIITPETLWSLHYFEPRPHDLPDYPSLGIDKNALYIGMNLLSSHGYITSDGFVIPKAPLLEGKLTPFAFYEMVDPDPNKFEGPLSPQGVDNFDENASEGYFIGINGRRGHLMLRRIKDPAGHPSISDNIPIAVPVSNYPLEVPQKGSLKDNQFFLQGFDLRLGNTHIRDQLLYTAHNIGVDQVGNPEASKPSRDGCLWYEINLKDPKNPLVNQKGVVYQPSPENDLEQRYFWMPGVMTNGLHTLLMACCTAGDQVYADAAYAMRYSDDPLGTMRKPEIYTKSTTLYQLGLPPFKNLRWGEYTTASVDPMDDMSLWCVSEFTLNAVSWGLQVIRIPSPGPAELKTITPDVIPIGVKELNITIHGERVDGSAFFDTNKSFSNHLKVEIENVEVKKIKWISPTQIDLVISTEFSSIGPKDIKITNPDGQEIIYDFPKKIHLSL